MFTILVDGHSVSKEENPLDIDVDQFQRVVVLPRIVGG